MTAPNTPPTRPPTAAELLAEPMVQAALTQAWLDSDASDPLKRHEEGGWIYLDTINGQLTIRRAPPGIGASIDLARPQIVPGAVIVAEFHTHPNPSADGWNPGPSVLDMVVDTRHGVPDLIQADNGTYVSGPAERTGGLAGGPGFPP